MKRCKEDEHDPISFKTNKGMVTGCAKCKRLLSASPKEHGLDKDEIRTLIDYHLRLRIKYGAK